MSLQPYFILGAILRDEVRLTQNCNLLVCLNENCVKVTVFLRKRTGQTFIFIDSSFQMTYFIGRGFTVVQILKK